MPLAKQYTLEAILSLLAVQHLLPAGEVAIIKQQHAEIMATHWLTLTPGLQNDMARRLANWARRKAYAMVLAENGFRPSRSGTDAPSSNRVSAVLSIDGLARLIASFI